MSVSDNENDQKDGGSGGGKKPHLRAVVAMPENRSLTEAHREHLHASGLSDETLKLAELYSERIGSRIADMLSWKSWKNGEALVFPFFLPGSSGPVMYRVRPSRPRETSGGKLVKYEQPKGVQVAPYLPPRARIGGWLSDASRPLLWVEGEKKALLLDQLGYATVGGTGVSCFHDATHRRDSGAWRLSEPLREHITSAGRAHLIVFDSDSETNDQVMLAARRLAGMLLAAGAASVRFVQIPMGPDGKKLGIDDYCVAFGEDATRNLLANGTVEIDPLPVEEPFTPLRSQRALRDAPVEERLRMPEGYSFGSDGSLYEKGTGERPDELVMLRPLLLRRILVDHRTGRENVELVFPREGSWRTATAERAVVCSSRRIVDELASVGAPVDSGNAGSVVTWLRTLEAVNERRLPRTLSVDACGWHDLDGELVFLAPDRIGEGRELAFDGGLGRSRIVRGLRTKGDAQVHLEALRKAFSSDRVAATAICAALAAPMLRLLGAPGFALHLVGDSSRGKSSMLKIAASIYGDPSSEDWVPSWNSTTVGLEQRAATLCDLPFCIDEAGVVDPKQREMAVYMLIDGTGRTRGARGGGLRDTASWRTIVLSTGEHGLVDEEANTGAQVRVLQFQVAGFGSLDATGVDALRGACAENHGAVGRQWIEALQGMDWTAGKAAFREFVKQARARASSNGLRARQAEYLALLAFAEGIASSALGLGSATGETMLTWLLDEDRERDRKEVESVADRALALVQDWFVSARGSFAELDLGFNGEIEAKDLGMRELLGYRNDELVAFIPAKLRSYLTQHRIDWQVVREWQRRGWLLVNESSRGTRRSMVNGMLVRTVAFRAEVLVGDGVSHGKPS